MAPSPPPPPGYYVPAVLFFDQNEEFDIPAIRAHVLRLAQVSTSRRLSMSPAQLLVGRRYWDTSTRV